ncbi:uncharacterized protein K441DRAFT_667497 [Cenococcum geophilum 1.58]|uniref:uncharacterized protein n=1 Tax=Cenococcum geophilum 1.58 TaxID=794803 RepID=UPI00358E7651|nr:hypothetical protein K441DRAFT_667497 [Cenococcum geophilum 1.58]
MLRLSLVSHLGLFKCRSRDSASSSWITKASSKQNLPHIPKHPHTTHFTSAFASPLPLPFPAPSPSLIPQNLAGTPLAGLPPTPSLSYTGPT